MADRLCNKGWLLAPSPTDGKDVPFFIHVRSQDIVWDEEAVSKELLEIANQGENVEVSFPQCGINFDKNEWNISLNDGKRFTANTKVNISSVFEVDDEYAIRSVIKLPFNILNNENFNVQLSMITDKVELMCSNAVVLPYRDEEIDEIEVIIYNKEGSLSNFQDNIAYDESFICITINGIIK